MKRRGQSVTLKNNETGQEVSVVVVLADSMQGYLAADKKKLSPMVAHFIDGGDWNWYHPDQWTEL